MFCIENGVYRTDNLYTETYKSIPTHYASCTKFTFPSNNPLDKAKGYGVQRYLC